MSRKFAELKERVLVDIDNERPRDQTILGLSQSDEISNFSGNSVTITEGDYIYTFTENFNDDIPAYIFAEGIVIQNPYQDFPYKWCCKLVGEIEYSEDYDIAKSIAKMTLVQSKENMKNHLIERWKNDQLIGIDILIRSDGSAVILNYGCFSDDNGKRYYCHPTCDTTIESIEKYDDDIWTECQVFVEHIDPDSDKIYVAGEGGMGNEGFMACLDKEKQPIWALFFVNSNPFYELEIKNGYLEAVSSHDLKFSINLESPERVEISHFEWRT